MNTASALFGHRGYDAPHDRVEQAEASRHRRDRRLNHLLGGHLLPGDVESGVERKLPDKLALGTAIALAEGMQRVEFAEIIGQPRREFAVRQTYEIALASQVIEQLAGRHTEIDR